VCVSVQCTHSACQKQCAPSRSVPRKNTYLLKDWYQVGPTTVSSDVEVAKKHDSFHFPAPFIFSFLLFVLSPRPSLSKYNEMTQGQECVGAD